MELSVDSLVRFLMKPYGIVLITVCVSFIGWILYPYTQGFDAFRNPEPLFSRGGLIILVWYGSIILISMTFFALGRRSSWNVMFFDRYANLNDSWPYLLFTLASLLGTYACVSRLASMIGWSGVWTALIEQKGRIFYALNLGDYHKGILTLRHLAPLSGGLALYRIITFRRIGLVDALNILSILVLVFVVNSRLSFVSSILFGTALYIFNNRILSVPWFKLAFFGLIAFSLLTLFNSARNGQTFKQEGNDSAISANLAEIAAYLGTPFQVSLAVGNKYQEARNGEFFTQLASVHRGMTTNSVLYDSVHSLGNWAWPVIGIEVAVLAFIMGMSSLYRRNYLILLNLICLYIFAEFWRINLLSAGGFQFMLLISFLGAVVLAAVNKLLGRETEVEYDEDEIEDGIHDEMESEEAFDEAYEENESWPR